ncbi:MAG: SDR family NAD(P)-dependent oxidoreductase [Acidimicrobiia bacterium]
MTEKTAVVTGGASGIGFALAQQLGTRGYSVVLADRNVDELEAAEAELRGAGVAVASIECDVRHPESMLQVAGAVTSEHGPVDVLCANAGVSGPPVGLVWSTHAEDWPRVYAVNVFGVVNTLSAFLPGMIAEARGQVLVTGSITGLVTMQVNAPIYVSSKHAVFSVVDSVREQLEVTGSPVKIQFLAPGGVATRIMEHEAAAVAELGGRDTASEPPVVLQSARPTPSTPPERFEPHQVAAIAVAALDGDEFIIYTHSGSRDLVRQSLTSISASLE